MVMDLMGGDIKVEERRQRERGNSTFGIVVRAKPTTAQPKHMCGKKKR